MKTIIFLAAVLGAMPSFAQSNTTAKETEPKMSHLQMHEQMAKAHQQAADCLKSGKSQDECRKGFEDMCKESGSHEMCGSGMMHRKMDKKANGKKTKY